MRRRLGQTTPASARASHADKPMTVAELSRKITRLLEGEIGRVRVEGEISNYRVPRSGHAYFLLKDEECAINAVCFRSTLAGLKVALADGKKIEVTGRITAYTARSEYQIIIESAREAGLGELMRRFIELRDKLKAEGLFDAARKIHLPFLPRVIGIVTSSTGAALRDILNVLGRRAGGLEIILSPCAVQ
ncbi:exodeoxyribonuclease VII large subunit, partial [Candidatus Sumerlaeota bacterium]|nr:exodeoxyribonuclease VII large subunit [Candidatus Sumerlaeota bacterium]